MGYKTLEAFPRGKKCLLCLTAVSDPEKLGEIYETAGVIVHYFCLLLASKVEQNGKDNAGILGFYAKDIKKEAKRGSKIVCSYCKKNGATIRCAKGKCNIVFHFPCGLDNGSSHHFVDTFKSFCKKHTEKQVIPAKLKTQAQECVICSHLIFFGLEKYIWPPCCKPKALLHMRCTQRLASSAGYYLKCPLCNNKADFCSGLKILGIFIPEREASWEVEPHAFQELMETPKECEAKVCKCPQGRTHFTVRTKAKKWQIEPCMSCGAIGIHHGCMEEQIRPGTYECSTCVGVSKRLTENVARENEEVETPEIAPSPVDFEDGSSNQDSYSHDSSDSEGFKQFCRDRRKRQEESALPVITISDSEEELSFDDTLPMPNPISMGPLRERRRVQEKRQQRRSILAGAARPHCSSADQSQDIFEIDESGDEPEAEDMPQICGVVSLTSEEGRKSSAVYDIFESYSRGYVEEQDVGGGEFYDGNAEELSYGSLSIRKISAGAGSLVHVNNVYNLTPAGFALSEGNKSACPQEGTNVFSISDTDSEYSSQGEINISDFIKSQSSLSQHFAQLAADSAQHPPKPKAKRRKKNSGISQKKKRSVNKSRSSASEVTASHHLNDNSHSNNFVVSQSSDNSSDKCNDASNLSLTSIKPSIENKSLSSPSKKGRKRKNILKVHSSLFNKSPQQKSISKLSACDESTDISLGNGKTSTPASMKHRSRSAAPKEGEILRAALAGQTSCEPAHVLTEQVRTQASKEKDINAKKDKEDLTMLGTNGEGICATSVQEARNISKLPGRKERHSVRRSCQPMSESFHSQQESIAEDIPSLRQDKAEDILSQVVMPQCFESLQKGKSEDIHLQDEAKAEVKNNSKVLDTHLNLNSTVTELNYRSRKDEARKRISPKKIHPTQEDSVTPKDDASSRKDQCQLSTNKFESPNLGNLLHYDDVLICKNINTDLAPTNLVIVEAKKASQTVEEMQTHPTTKNKSPEIIERKSLSFSHLKENNLKHSSEKRLIISVPEDDKVITSGKRKNDKLSIKRKSLNSSTEVMIKKKRLAAMVLGSEKKGVQTDIGSQKKRDNPVIAKVSLSSPLLITDESLNEVKTASAPDQSQTFSSSISFSPFQNDVSHKAFLSCSLLSTENSAEISASAFSSSNFVESKDNDSALILKEDEERKSAKKIEDSNEPELQSQDLQTGNILAFTDKNSSESLASEFLVAGRKASSSVPECEIGINFDKDTNENLKSTNNSWYKCCSIGCTTCENSMLFITERSQENLKESQVIKISSPDQCPPKKVLELTEVKADDKICNLNNLAESVTELQKEKQERSSNFKKHDPRKVKVKLNHKSGSKDVISNNTSSILGDFDGRASAKTISVSSTDTCSNSDDVEVNEESLYKPEFEDNSKGTRLCSSSLSEPLKNVLGLTEVKEGGKICNLKHLTESNTGFEKETHERSSSFEKQDLRKEKVEFNRKSKVIRNDTPSNLQDFVAVAPAENPSVSSTESSSNSDFVDINKGSLKEHEFEPDSKGSRFCSSSLSAPLNLDMPLTQPTNINLNCTYMKFPIESSTLLSGTLYSPGMPPELTKTTCDTALAHVKNYVSNEDSETLCTKQKETEFDQENVILENPSCISSSEVTSTKNDNDYDTPDFEDKNEVIAIENGSTETSLVSSTVLIESVKNINENHSPSNRNEKRNDILVNIPFPLSSPFEDSLPFPDWYLPEVITVHVFYTEKEGISSYNRSFSRTTPLSRVEVLKPENEVFLRSYFLDAFLFARPSEVKIFTDGRGYRYSKLFMENIPSFIKKTEVLDSTGDLSRHLYSVLNDREIDCKDSLLVLIISIQPTLAFKKNIFSVLKLLSDKRNLCLAVTTLLNENNDINKFNSKLCALSRPYRYQVWDINKVSFNFKF